jgi:hypothetical protein
VTLKWGGLPMSDEEIIQILKNLSEHLHFASIFTDLPRWIAWAFVSGLAWIVDALEGVTNEMLFVKEFFQDPEIIAFTQSIRPLLIMLLAVSFLYAGYLIMFQRKINREAIAINIILAMSIILLLSPGMQKMNQFTDEAVKVLNNGELFGTESGTVSQNILSRNITDLVELDKENFSNTDKINSIPIDMVSRIKITDRLDYESDNLNLGSVGEEVSKHYLTWNGTETTLAEFDQGGFADWNNEYYYRYSLDWFTIIGTLMIIGFTLFSIAYKLSRLSYELVFNYVLAMLIAPADVHDGQKTKKVILSIFNTFLVIILIFLSMKIYIIGTDFLQEKTSGLVYILAMLGFSVALLDGPNIVERLFGIDAGLKSGWGVLAGAYAAARLASGLANGVHNIRDKFKTKGDSKDGAENNNDTKDASDLRSRSPLNNQEAASPFENSKDSKNSRGANVNGYQNTDINNSDEASEMGISNGANSNKYPLSNPINNEQLQKMQQALQESTKGGASPHISNAREHLQSLQNGQDNFSNEQSEMDQSSLNNETGSTGNPSNIEKESQANAEQRVNAKEVQNVAQKVNGNVVQNTGAASNNDTTQMNQSSAQSSLAEGNTTSSIEQQSQSNTSQQVSMKDVQNGVPHVSNNSQQQVDNPSGINMPTHTSANSGSNNASLQNSENTIDNKMSVQQDNVSRKNDEVIIEQTNRILNGEQNVKHVESTSNTSSENQNIGGSVATLDRKDTEKTVQRSETESVNNKVYMNESKSILENTSYIQRVNNFNRNKQ